MTGRGWWRVVVAVLGLMVASAPAQADDHADKQVARIAHIKDLLSEGKSGEAKAYAETEANAARADGAPTRQIDALEFEREILMADEDWTKAYDVSAKVMEGRKVSAAAEPALYFFALISHAAIAYGAGHEAETDKALLEARDAVRLTYPANDLRRAGALEQLAGNMAQWGRPLLALDLRREALAQREALGKASPQALAGALQDLGMLEMSQGQSAVADAHIARAVPLLQSALAVETSPERKLVLSGGASQLLILRAGIASSDGRTSDAASLIAQSRKFVAKTGPDADQLAFFEAVIARDAAERHGDTAAAVELSLQLMDRAQRLTSADAQGTLADTVAEAGYALLRANRLDEARDYLNLALKYKTQLGEPTWQIQLRLSEIAERQGRLEDSKQLQAAALAQHKSGTSEVHVFFGTNRSPHAGVPGRFDATPLVPTEVGDTLILVPGGPGSGEAAVKLDQLLPKGLTPSTDPARLIALKPVRLETADFDQQIDVAAQRAHVFGHSALVFIHGFGTTFEGGVMRAGQLARDINFDGPVIAFSWPSQGKLSLLDYRADEQSANGSVDALIAFLGEVAASEHIDKIHLVAHSMGNQLLLAALLRIAKEGPPTLRDKIGEVVFASPDVDSSAFKTGTESLHRAGMTLYANARDQALNVSWLANLFSRRAGSVAWGLLASGQPVIAKGVDSINVTAAGPDLLATNHDLYASNAAVTDDVRRLLSNGAHPPDARNPDVYRRCSAGQQPFWTYVPVGTPPGPC